VISFPIFDLRCEKDASPNVMLKCRRKMFRLSDCRRALPGRLSKLLLFGILLLFASGINAQSGRRSTKPTEKTSPEPQRKVSLLVSIEDRDQFSNIPYYLADSALDACIDRLRDAPEVSVSSAARGMSRADAAHRSKTEKAIYVVWLQIVADLPDSKKPSKNGPQELYLRYTIFEPGTAMVKTEGRTQHLVYRTSGGGMSSPSSSRNSPIYSEYALKQAAREAAESVMRAFEIKVPEESVPR
jgi:hypothetical protein